MIRNLRCTVTIDSVLANSKTHNAFLFTVNAIFLQDYPLAVEPGSTPSPLVQKKLGEILYLFICSFLPCLSWLLRSRIRKSRRDLWITLYKKFFRFVKVISTIPLYVIEIKWIYPILHKILAWLIALSIRYYRTPMFCFLCFRLSERYYYLITNISTCRVYIATLTYTLMTKYDQPIHLIDQYLRGIDLTSQLCSYNILVLVANIHRQACATMINN